MASLCVVAGCGDGTGDATVVPAVIATSPADQATGVDPSAVLEATFSENMAANTLDATTFVISRDGATVTGTVSYTAATRVATFHPSTQLSLLGSYTATVTTGATDLAGTPLASDSSWTFTVRDGQWTTAEFIEAENLGAARLGQLAVDAAGNAIAVWQQSNGASTSIWANRFVPGSGWGIAAPIETSSLTDNPQVAINASGTAVAVWEHYDGVQFSTWANRFVPGSGWGTAMPIETDDATYAHRPQVAIDAAGNATAVWNHGASIVASRFVPGSGWSIATPIETETAAADNPQVTVDDAGNVIAVWTQSAGGFQNVYANRFVAGSGWGTAAPLETDNGAAGDPQVAMNAAGNAIAVWTQTDGTRFNIWATRFVPGSGWATATLIETDDAGDAYSARVGVDPSGNAIAVWYQRDSTRDNVWANRFVPGSGWGTATLIETDNGTAVGPQVAIDPSGNAVAVWQQYDGTTRYDIWANRFVPGSGWGTATLIETDGGNATGAKVAMDVAGNATAVWSQSDLTRDNMWANSFR